MLASERGHLEATRVLVEAGVDKECRGRGGQTAIMLASEKGHLEVLRLLLEAGACRNCWDNATRHTALMLASDRGHVEVARLLLESGAVKDCTESHGKTALMLASESDHLEVVRLLLEAGAARDCAEHDRNTGLMLGPLNHQCPSFRNSYLCIEHPTHQFKLKCTSRFTAFSIKVICYGDGKTGIDKVHHLFQLSRPYALQSTTYALQRRP